MLYNQAPDPENPGQMQYSLSSTAQYAYDMFGRLASATDFKGQGKDFVYDVLGRLTNKYYGSVGASTRIAYTYDDFGYLTQIDSWCGASCQDTIRYEYDSEGRLQYRSGVGYGTIGYHYDLAGRPGAHVWPVAPGASGGLPKTTEVRYTYNMAGGLAALNVDGAAGALALYGYNNAGQVQLITLENGTSVVMSYDGTYGRLSSLVNRDKNNATMTSFAYTYNLDGYVTSVTRENGDTIDYQYDGVGRLMDEWRKAGGGSTVYRNRFQYDAVGNRTQWIADTPGDATTCNYTYNTLNQVTEWTWSKGGDSYVETYAHDLNGNVTSKEERKNAVLQERWEYEWDSEDRLVKVVQKDGSLATLKTVEYAYCPACGGGLTHRIVRSSTGAITKWLQYENEGGRQLRIDEKWDQDGNGLDEADPWRTERVTYNGRSGIVKELVYRYGGLITDAPSEMIPIY